MAKVVKSCDFPVGIALHVFKMLNPSITTEPDPFAGSCIVTDTEPMDLTYPEGWYFAKGNFRNKHTSTTGMYSEIPMKKADGTYWCELVNYSTME
ncbi:MAG: hypothetical protein IKI57_03300 [Clostridia bacterium]|nr:hypothetical protein [Clostridia bacterium]